MINYITFKNRKIEILIQNNNKHKTALFIHGFSSNFIVFEPIIQLLSKDYNICAINMPSHGNSEIAPELMNMESFRDIVAHFAQTFNLQNVTLIGHSMGGGIASMASSILQEFKILDKVVLIAPMNRTMLIFRHLWPLFFPRTYEEYTKLVPILLKNPEIILQNEQLTDQMRQYYQSESTQRRLDVIYQWGSRMPEEHNQEVVDLGIASIAVPCALINGDHDGIVNVEICNNHYKKLNEKIIPFVIKDAGHNIWIDNWNQFSNVLVEFLNK